jgi:hypothetical protein
VKPHIPAALAAAAGGLLSAALLTAGSASASGGEDAGTAVFPDVPGQDAFTIGQTTFDPFTVGSDGSEVEGFTQVTPLFSIPPFVEIGGGNLSLLGSALPTATQAFDVYSAGSTPTLLGIVDTNEETANIFGVTNTEFTVSQVGGLDGVPASSLPVDGTVYDVLNLGNGLENVYVDVPGTAGGTVSDTFVTPFGDIDLSSLFSGFDATQLIDPGNAFTGLTDATSLLGDLFSL